MADKDLTIKIDANTQAAVEGFSNLSKQITQTNDTLKIIAESLTHVEKASESLGEHALHLNAAMELMAKAFEAAHKVFEVTVEKFIEADDAAQTLGNTLRLIGTKDVEAAIKGFQEFAEELQKTSVVSEDTAIGLAGMAKAIGLTDAQTKQLIQTSADLSAVTGKDVKSTFDNLLTTYKGVGRSAAEYDQRVQGLSVSQLKNGAAVALLAEKYKGFAQAQSKTLGGQLAQVRNLYENTLEDVGKLFAKFFKLGDQHLAIEALTKLRKFLEDITPAVEQVRASIDEFIGKITAGFDAISDKASVFKAALVPIAAVVAAAFGPAVLAWIAAFAVELAAAAASGLLLTAQLLAIAAAATAVAAAIEFIYNNFTKLGDIGNSIIKALKDNFDAFFKAIKDEIKAIMDAFVALFKGIASIGSGGGFSGLISGGKEAADKLFDGFTKAEEDFKKSRAANNKVLVEDLKKVGASVDFGVAGKAIEGMTQFAKGFTSAAKENTEAQTNLNTTVARSASAYQVFAQDAIKAIEAVKKKILELTTSGAELGGNVVEIAKAKLGVENANIDALRKQMVDTGALDLQGKVLLANARALAQINSDQSVDKQKADALNGLIDKTGALGDEVNAQNMTQVELIDRKLEKQLDELQNTYDQLKAQGLLTGEMEDQLNLQRELAKKRAAKDKAAAPPPAIEAATKGLTDAFAPITSFTGAVGGYIAAAQAVVDAGPQMLDSITHLIDSITDLPMKLLSSLNKLIDSIFKFIANIIPNIVHAIEGIFKSLGNLFKTLPAAIMSALKAIPGLITELLTQLPDLIKDLLTGLMEALPAIVIGLVEFLIKYAPKIALQLAWFLAIELPKAIIGAMINVFKDLAKMVGNLFKGKFDLIDGAKIKDTIQNVAKEISASASKLFSVTDLANATKDAKALTNEVAAAGRDVIDKIKSAFKWVWDNILKPIGDLVMKAFQWVWDNILKPIGDLVMKAFQWVWDNILKPITDLVMKAFQWVWDNVFKPITDLVTKVFQWVWDNVFKPITDMVMKVFQWVWDTIFKPITDLVTKAFMWVYDNIIKPIADLGKTIWDGFVGGVKGVGDIFTGFGGAIWEGLKAGLSGLGKFLTDMFAALDPSNLFKKIFAVDMGGRGTVEKALGIDVPFMSFAQGGLVPGQAAVPGNSDLNDKIVAMLSPGEAIISREMMNNPAIRALVQQILSGKLTPPKFKLGGILGKAADKISAGSSDIGDKISAGADNLGDALMSGLSDVGSFLGKADPWELVKKKVFEAIMKMFQANHFSQGGIVGDTIPAMLSPGEFVMNRGAVSGLGAGNLAAMNSGRGGASVNNYKIDLTMTVENKGDPIDANFVRLKIVPTIKDELRKATLKGDLLISNKGVF